MNDLKQNPYTCGDGGCVLRVPGAHLFEWGEK
jgi:hypothetical protein